MKKHTKDNGFFFSLSLFFVRLLVDLNNIKRFDVLWCPLLVKGPQKEELVHA
jgi:hypothetical protein